MPTQRHSVTPYAAETLNLVRSSEIEIPDASISRVRRPSTSKRGHCEVVACYMRLVLYY